MLKNLASVMVVLAAAVLGLAIAVYAMLVVGSRRGVEYYYGR